MPELHLDEIEQVAGGWGVAEHTALQMGVVGLGAHMVVAGMTLTPFGALVFIGLSIASTVTVVSGGGSGKTKKLIESSDKKKD